MKLFYVALIVPCMLIGLPAVAQQTPLVPQTQGEVTFVSGGVGEEERDALKSLKSDYNLGLLFSEQGTGEYFSDVNVSIKDSKGKVCLETVSDGPMLYAKLKPGHYSISADFEGRVLHKAANLSGKKWVSVSFSWPKRKED